VHAGIKGEEYLVSAEECCNKIFEINPGSRYGHYLLGIIAYKRNKILEAISQMERVIRDDPVHSDTLKWLQEYDVQNAGEENSKQLEKKLLGLDPLTSFDEYNNELPSVSGDEIKNFFRYVRKPKIAFSAILIILILTALLVWYSRYRSNVRWAKEHALEEIAQNINEVNYVKAFELIQKAERYLSEDPEFKRMAGLAVTRLSILTDPAGVDIYIKEYGDFDGEWEKLGITPIDGVKLPNLMYYLMRFEKSGYTKVMGVAATSIIVGSTPADTIFRKLFPEGSIPEEMVYVEDLGDEMTNNFMTEKKGFFLDRHEVTNRQFKEFVNNGGYSNPEFWKQEFIKDGKILSWEEAMAEFVDKSGRPGPATWEASDYPNGQDDYPVSGVSWYEAAAYAEYVHKSLPTISHWGSGFGLPIGPFKSIYAGMFGSRMLPISNFRGIGPESVNKLQDISCFGAYGMAGNVREWCWNETDVGHVIRGGAWDDATYMYSSLSQLPAFDRSPKNGFRCVSYVDQEKIPESVFEPVELSEDRDFYKEKPVSDEVFTVYKNQFSYDKLPLDGTLDEIDKNQDDWILEKVSFNAAYANERVIAYLYLPRNANPPYQTIIFFPGAYAHWGWEKDLRNSQFTRWYVDYLVKNGYAVMYPVYKGTYERINSKEAIVRGVTHQYTEWLIKWVKDFSRSIDYLETRKDIDTDKIAYYGHSWGARLGAIIPAVEDRIKISILVTGGLGGRHYPEAEEISYVPRVKTPVLMLNGRYDMYFILEKDVKPFFDLLGTPQEDKLLRLYETDHYVPANEMIKETLNWLDKYFGPVERKTASELQ